MPPFRVSQVSCRLRFLHRLCPKPASLAQQCEDRYRLAAARLIGEDATPLAYLLLPHPGKRDALVREQGKFHPGVCLGAERS